VLGTVPVERDDIDEYDALDLRPVTWQFDRSEILSQDVLHIFDAHVA
jgi:hypothetical protein